MDDREALKNCPFCHGVLNCLTTLANHYAVQCGHCEASGPWKETPEEAEAAWQSRSSVEGVAQAQAGQEAVEIIQALKASVAVGSDKEWVSIRRHVRDAAVAALAASAAQGGEPERMSAREQFLYNIRQPHASADELDWHGELFGFTRTEREGHGDLVTVYVEDDENWHAELSFDVLWLKEFLALAQAVQPQGAAAPAVAEEPIYQGRIASAWHDCTEEAFWTFPEKDRRIVYASPLAQQPHPQGAEERELRIDSAFEEFEQYKRQGFGYLQAFRKVVAALGEQEQKDRKGGEA